MGKKINNLKPVIFRNSSQIPKGVKKIDICRSALEELFFIRHPRFKKERPEARKPLHDFLEKMSRIEGIWIYLPWKKLLIHSLPESLFFEIKTARNKNILTKPEQERYRRMKVGIIGASIGSNIVWPLLISGGPKTLKIADPDYIELSNLNRILAPLSAIGENKATFLARQIWEMDPFVKVYCFTDGVTKEGLKNFISDNPKLDIVIDEMDDLHLKFLTRLTAKKQRIPVIMVTNVGNNLILDVERFDLDKNYPIFHGMMKKIKTENLNKISYDEWVKLATQIVGPQHLSARMKKTLREIGKRVAAVPQLGSTALMSGCIATLAIMRMAVGQSLKSGRYFFNIENYF